MLGQRVVTAVVLLCVLFAVVASRHLVVFAAFVGITIIAAAWEFDRMSRSSYVMTLLMAVIFIVYVTIFLVLQKQPGTINIQRPLGAVVASIVWILLVPLRLRQPMVKFVPSLQARIYIFIMLFAAGFSAIYLFVRDRTLLGLVVAVPIIADSFAYFVGRAVGKRKLAPAISPGKTMEGALGGLVAVAVLYTAWVVYAKWAWWWVLFFVFLGAMSIIGDLFESLLKRQTGVKDSSNLLPGHGGVLDRIDAQLPVLPMAALAFQTLPLR